MPAIPAYLLALHGQKAGWYEVGGSVNSLDRHWHARFCPDGQVGGGRRRRIGGATAVIPLHHELKAVHLGREITDHDNLVIVPGLGQAAPNGEANQRLTIKGCDADAECDHWILLRSFAPGISQQ